MGAMAGGTVLFLFLSYILARLDFFSSSACVATWSARLFFLIGGKKVN